MNEADRLLMLLGALVYAGALIVSALRLGMHRPPLPHFVWWIVIGFALQTTGLVMRGESIGGCPVGNPYETLQFASWSIIGLYLLLGPVFRMSLFGVFCSAFAAGVSLASHLFPSWDHPHPPSFGGDFWVELHASLSIFSYGALGILAACSVMYLIQHYSLKHKSYDSWFHFLPPLTQLERVGERLQTIAVVCFSAALAAGSVSWMGELDRTSAFKLAFAFALWAGYLAAFALRLCGVLHGLRLAWSHVILFLFALLTLWPVEVDRIEMQGRISKADLQPDFLRLAEIGTRVSHLPPSLSELPNLK